MQPFVSKIFVLSIFEWPHKIGLAVLCLIYFYNFRQNPITVHNEWLYKTSKKDEKDVSKVYQNVYQKYSYTETLREMNLIENRIPWDLSR